VDFFPSACGAESVSSLMDESSLMRLSSADDLSMVEASQHFRYFVVDRSDKSGKTGERFNETFMSASYI
jgi:hypothetical protein